MKRKEFIQYLRSQGCEMIREGSNHSWWCNPAFNTRSAIPRHNEINDFWLKKFVKTSEFHQLSNLN